MIAESEQKLLIITLKLEFVLRIFINEPCDISFRFKNEKKFRIHFKVLTALK